MSGVKGCPEKVVGRSLPPSLTTHTHIWLADLGEGGRKRGEGKGWKVT